MRFVDDFNNSLHQAVQAVSRQTELLAICLVSAPFCLPACAAFQSPDAARFANKGTSCLMIADSAEREWRGLVKTQKQGT